MTKVKKTNINPILTNSKGFTILEIIAVIVIIGLLWALVATNFIGKVDEARQVDAQAQIGLLGQALDLYRLEKGKYPSNEEGLKAIQPYLKKELPKDPWGNPYKFLSPGVHAEIDVFSYGADGAQGGTGRDADIGSWDL